MVVRIFAETCFEVVSLAFSNFLQQQFSVELHVFQESIHALRVLLTCVTIRCFTPETGNRYITFIMIFRLFQPKNKSNTIQLPLYKSIILLSFVLKIYKENYKEFPFKCCSFLCSKVPGKKKFSNRVKVFPTKLYFTEQNVLLKQPTNQSIMSI